MKIRDHYEVRIRDSGPPIGDEDVDRCEAALGLRFPAGYREFLLLHNGGKPKPGCFLLNPVVSPKIDLLYSILPETPDRDLRSECLRLRADFELPASFVPVGKIAEDCFLLLDCSEEAEGAVYYWLEVGDGFHLGESDYWTVFRLYFPIDQLLMKLGPRRDRKDMDGLFFRLYWVASNAQSGARTAQQLVDAGYDINFVLPDFVHPVFAAIKGDAFDVAEQLVVLGTRRDHVDNEGVSVADRLVQSLEWCRNRLAEHKKGESIHEMAKRRIRAIRAALEVYSVADGDGG